MIWLWRFGLTLLLVVAGFLVGGRIGALTVPDDAGLASGATVFLWATGGAVVAVVGAAIGMKRSTRRSERR